MRGPQFPKEGGDTLQWTRVLGGGDLKTERYPDTEYRGWLLALDNPHSGAFYLDEMSKGSQCASEVL